MGRHSLHDEIGDEAARKAELLIAARSAGVPVPALEPEAAALHAEVANALRVALLRLKKSSSMLHDALAVVTAAGLKSNLEGEAVQALLSEALSYSARIEFERERLRTLVMAEWALRDIAAGT